MQVCVLPDNKRFEEELVAQLEGLGIAGLGANFTWLTLEVTQDRAWSCRCSQMYTHGGRIRSRAVAWVYSSLKVQSTFGESCC